MKAGIVLDEVLRIYCELSLLIVWTKNAVYIVWFDSDLSTW